MKMAAQQENPMTSTQHTVSGPGTAGFDGGLKPAAPGPAFKIRYGRLALALAGLLALLTGLVSAVLRIFGLGPLWLPVAALLGAVASVLMLRWLAVRDRRRKMNAAFRSAMSAPARPSRSAPERTPLREPAGEPRERAESPLFDAQADAAERKPAPKPLTAQELRQAALAEAVASGDTSVRRHRGFPGRRRIQLGAGGSPEAHVCGGAESRTGRPRAARSAGSPKGRRKAVAQAGPSAGPGWQPRHGIRIETPGQGAERPEQPGRCPAATPGLNRYFEPRAASNGRPGLCCVPDDRDPAEVQ